jgi:hypothetical protein
MDSASLPTQNSGQRLKTALEIFRVNLRIVCPFTLLILIAVEGDGVGGVVEKGLDDVKEGIDNVKEAVGLGGES